MESNLFQPNQTSSLIILIFSTLLCFNLNGQEPEKASAKKQRARLSMDFHNVDNSHQRLEATLRIKVEGYYKGIEGATINFYQEEISDENKLGNAVTDINGKAIFPFSQSATNELVTYIAALQGHHKYRDIDRDIEIKKAMIELTTEVIDSIPMVTALVTTYDSAENIVPVEEVTLTINVQRLYGLLPISEESETDEDGLVEIELPTDIPGDHEGNLIIVANVEDHDEYGNLRVSRIVPYGVPLKEDQEIGEIWLASPTSNASRLLMMVTNAVILVILGVVVYILIELFRIKKLGQQV